MENVFCCPPAPGLVSVWSFSYKRCPSQGPSLTAASQRTHGVGGGGGGGPSPPSRAVVGSFPPLHERGRVVLTRHGHYQSLTVLLLAWFLTRKRTLRHSSRYSSSLRGRGTGFGQDLEVGGGPWGDLPFVF